MALSKETIAFSTKFPDAYYQIIQATYSSASINSDKPNCAINIALWSSKESRDAEGDSPIHQFTEYFNIDISKAYQNPIKKGYEFLKTLDSMADCKDV